MAIKIMMGSGTPNSKSKMERMFISVSKKGLKKPT